MSVKLISITNDPELKIMRASQVCRNIFEHGRPDNRTIVNYVRTRMDVGHWGVLEHASASVLWRDISRACSHQLVRHRIASYCQTSQRYTEPSGDAGFVTPPSIITAGKQDLFAAALKHVYSIYEELLDVVPKEDARFILPNATMTNIMITMNFRSWRHFFKLRCGQHAQWEIRRMAAQTLDLLQAYTLATFGDFVIHKHTDGSITRVEIPENCE